jgi:hypothetical protein
LATSAQSFLDRLPHIQRLNERGEGSREIGEYYHKFRNFNARVRSGLDALKEIIAANDLVSLMRDADPSTHGYQIRSTCESVYRAKEKLEEIYQAQNAVTMPLPNTQVQRPASSRRVETIAPQDRAAASARRRDLYEKYLSLRRETQKQTAHSAKVPLTTFKAYLQGRFSERAKSVRQITDYLQGATKMLLSRKS